jgi:hypothetical protein
MEEQNYRNLNMDFRVSCKNNSIVLIILRMFSITIVDGLSVGLLD